MDIEIVQWAAEECYRQGSGERSVANMCEAWLFLTDQKGMPITPELIVTLGIFVEPEQNAKGFRRLPVWFVTGDVIGAEHIPHQIKNLCDFVYDMSPVQWYTEFEKIHPFIDGNGRVGSLLYNFICDTLYNPITPPDVFNNLPPCA